MMSATNDFAGNSDQTLVLFDRACPLCREEMLRLKRRDRKNSIRLVDVSTPGSRTYGFARAAVLARLHVRTTHGTWLIGMSAIRHVYRQVGLAWLVAPTAWPLLSSVVDWLYPKIAKNRVFISRWLGIGQHHDTCPNNICSTTDTPGGQP